MLDVVRTRSGSAFLAQGTPSVSLDTDLARSDRRARRLWLECRWSFPSASKTPSYLEFTGQSARQARLALVGLGDTCFNTLFLLFSILSMSGTRL